jgi:hypothetical protein
MLGSDWEDYEDATQYSSALEDGADCIVTRNTKDFTKSKIPVFTSSDFVSQIASK